MKLRSGPAILIALGIFLAVFVTITVGGSHSGSNSAAVPGSTNDFTFVSLHTDYTLGRDSAQRSEVAVKETFVAQFPATDQNHGILRAIPEKADGRSLQLHVESVTNPAGTPIPYQSEEQNGFRVLRIGDANTFVHGRRTYVVNYTMRDVIEQPSRGGAQRFAFDVNGTGWSQPFGTVSATLHVPAELASGLSGDNACFRGAQGSTARCQITRTADGFQVRANGIGPHQNVTMVVGFHAGTFAVPFPVGRLLVLLLFGIALLVLVLAIVVRAVQLKNPKGTGIIVPQYQPYPGIGVLEAAEILGESKRAFPALMTQLVVSRAATMVRDDRGTKRTSDDIYALQLGDIAALDGEDANAVGVLFGSRQPGASVRLNPKDRTVGDRIVRLLKNARKSVHDQGFITSRSTVGSWILLGVGIVAGVIAVVTLSQFTTTSLSTEYGLALGAVIACAIVTVGLTYPPRRRTAAATPVYEHLLGVRDYLKLAEADRIRMLQSPTGAETAPATGSVAEAARATPIDTVASVVSGVGRGGMLGGLSALRTVSAPGNIEQVKLYEKLLPYAILFNIEKEWREVLGGYWQTMPTDVTPNLLPANALVFGDTFAAGRYASSSSSSWGGSGGGFGGGSSGGGVGGGGGGGW